LKGNKKMKRQFTICAAVICLLWAGLAQGTSITVATFADPATGSGTPLFNVDTTNNKITGGWSDSQTGLNLQVAGVALPYQNAWFTINIAESLTSAQLGVSEPQSYWGMYFGKTGAGVITFYENGTNNKILKVEFNKAYVTPSSFGVSKTLDSAASITIYKGSSLIGTAGESFSFGFVNIQNTSTAPGYNATSSFSLSGAIPEPTTIALLSIGTLSLIRKRKVSI
jgi:hypothetical protein